MTFREIDYMNRWQLRLKHKRKYIKAWCDFVVSFGCIICGAPCEFSHSVPLAAKGACSDVLGHGICDVHHRTGNDSIHVLGSIEEFQHVHRISLNQKLFFYWTVYLRKHGRNIDVELEGLTDKNSVVEKLESLITELA